MRQLGSTELKRLHRSWARRTEERLALLLDGVQSPFNVGAIVRTAAALRVQRLYLTPTSASPSHPGARRLSMGTERYLPLVEVPRAADAVGQAAGDGYRVVALELTGDAQPLHELDLTGDICLVIGNEDHGVSRDALGAADMTGFLPQLGRVGSLNVAAAAAMAMYEVRRRSWARP